MKKALILLVVALSFGSAFNASAQLKIGTVDMKKVFDSYYKTKDAESRMAEARTAARKELEDRVDSHKKSLDEISRLNDEISKPELSKEAKDAKSKQRDDKIADLKNMEREIQEFQQTREKQLNEQMGRMRAGIVDEITKVINDRVKADQYDLVFDRSGPSLNGVPVLLYAKDSYDFTPDVITTLNKNKPKDDTASQGGGDTAPVKPAANPTPKKK